MYHLPQVPQHDRRTGLFPQQLQSFIYQSNEPLPLTVQGILNRYSNCLRCVALQRFCCSLCLCRSTCIKVCSGLADDRI